MNALLTYLVKFLAGSRETNNINLPVLVTALVVLLVALWICILVSKKNRLYISLKENDNIVDLQKGNEVA